MDTSKGELLEVSHEEDNRYDASAMTVLQVKEGNEKRMIGHLPIDNSIIC